MMVGQDNLKVVIAGSSFVNDWTIKSYMGPVLSRHPSVRLVALPLSGAAPVAYSVRYFADRVSRYVGPQEPYIALGQSQGAIVALRHSLTDERAKHIITVGGPFHGAWLSWCLLGIPAAWDLLSISPSLSLLREAVRDHASRITNIFCPSEQVMAAQSCYLPGVDNILVGSHAQIRQFRRHHPDLVFHDVVTTKQPVHHTDEIRSEAVREIIWSVADQVAAAYGLTFV